MERSEILATTYQEEDFALGTSEGDWGFQADELFCKTACNAPSWRRGCSDRFSGFDEQLICLKPPITFGVPERNPLPDTLWRESRLRSMHLSPPSPRSAVAINEKG